MTKVKTNLHNSESRKFWTFVVKTAKKVKKQEVRQGWKFARVTVTEGGNER